jgi:hypothetical protein
MNSVRYHNDSIRGRLTARKHVVASGSRNGDVTVNVTVHPAMGEFGNQKLGARPGGPCGLEKVLGCDASPAPGQTNGQGCGEGRSAVVSVDNVNLTGSEHPAECPDRIEPTGANRSDPQRGKSRGRRARFKRGALRTPNDGIYL